MRKLVDLMVGLSRHGAVAPRQADPARRHAQGETSRGVAPDCAIWHEIARALDAKPRTPR